MNPYDVLHYDVTQYEFNEHAVTYAAKAKRLAKIIRVLEILLAAAAIYGIFKLDVAAVLWIFIAVSVHLVVWQRVWMTHAGLKLYRISIKGYRDYLYYFYRRAKKQGHKNRYLLVLGKCNLQLGEYENCLLAMEQLDEKQLSLYEKGSYYLQRAIAKRILGDTEGFDREYLSYLAVTNEGSPEVDRRRRILSGDNPEECLSLIDILEPLKQDCKNKNFMFVIAGFLMLAMLFLQGRYLLPEGYEYRSWLENTGRYTILIGELILVSAVLVKGYRFVNGRLRTETAKVISNVVLTIMLIAEGLLFLFLFIGGVVNQKIEILSGNSLRVVETGISSGDRYYVCEPKGVFFRKFLFYEDSEFNFNQPGTDEKYFGNDYYGDGYDSGYYDDYNDYYNDYNYDEEYGTNGGEAILMEQLLMAEYQALYESEFQETDEPLKFEYSAKGNLFAVLGEYDLEAEDESTGAMKARKRLVYDRESQNGLYELFVCYKDYLDADGKEVGSSVILDFYAVEKTTFHVIRADKHAWSDSGSEEYREATGE